MYFEDKIYPFLLLLISAGAFALFFYSFRAHEKNLNDYEKIPRNHLWGTMLACIDLLWCAYEAIPLVPENMKVYLIPTALICTWLSYMFLDYIFSRAFGGFLILLAHYLLFESFGLRTPLSPLLPSISFLMGTFGIIISGKPYLLRDLIRKIHNSKNWRYSFASISFLYALAGLGFGLYHLIVIYFPQ